MKYKIYYDGRYHDELIIEEETIDDIRRVAQEELAKRNWDKNDCWSESVQ